MAHIRSFPASAPIQENIGFPGELVEDWHDKAIAKMGELLGKYRSLKVYMDACVHCGACTDKCHYFIGTNDRGLVTLYQGVPYRLPGNLALYNSRYVSGVSASTLTPQRRKTLLDHSLRSEANAASLIRSLELGQLE